MKRVVALLVICAACGESPTDLVRADRWVDISAGYFHTCALTALGRVFCWGGNEFGTLGNGTRTSSRSPVDVIGGTRIDSIDAGAGHTCALGDDGRALCWGQNDEGQLGDGSFTVRDRAVAVATALRFTTISAGHAHTCATTADGAAYCWGDDSRGQLGDGAGSTPQSPAPVRVPLNEPVRHIDAGYYQTCAAARSGAAYCWGANESGQLGSGSTVDAATPVRVNGLDDVSSIAAGDRFVCALDDGATWCWGDNRAAILGGTVAATSALPVRVPTPVLSVISASIGASTVGSAEPYVCALTADGQAVCWGGATRALRPAAAVPVVLPAPGRLRLITAGAQHVCVLDLAGEAWCGGANYAGQLGTDGVTDRADLTLVGRNRPPL